MENIDLAKFNFDISEVLQQAARLKQEMQEIKDEQKEMDKTSPEFVQTEADLKRLRSEYNQHIKVINQASTATKEIGDRQERLNAVLDEEVRTIKEARDQNKVLNQLRNDTNLTTEEGRAELALLNEQLNRNNEFIKENVDAYTQQKINIGNYKEDIKGAAEELNIFNGGLSAMVSRSQEAGGASQMLSNSLAVTTRAIKSTTTAALAFIATPVGAVVAAIAAAFLLVRNAMNRSEESTNKIRRAFSVFGGGVSALMKLLEPLGELLIDGIVAGLEAVESAAMSALDALSSAASWLGWEQAARGIDNFKESVEETSAASRELADAEAELRKAQRQSRLVQLEYQKDAERLRQIRDDEALSMQERIQANEELGRVLEQQLQDELQIAQQALQVANMRIAIEGEREDLLDAQADALTEIADIEERVNSQRSGQLTNQRTLEREIREERQAAHDERLKQLEEQRQAEEKAAEEARQRSLEAIDRMNERIQEDARIRREQAEFERLEDIQFREIAFAEEMDRMLSEGATRFDLERAQQAEQRAVRETELAHQREQGIISQELYNARLAELDREAKQQEVDREERLKEQKIDIAQGMIAAAGNVIDENSAAGKLLAIADATINTYRGIAAGVALGFPQAIPAVAFAASTGFKAVKDIMAQDVPSVSGRGNVNAGRGSASTMAATNLSGQGVNLNQLSASGNTAVQQNIEATLNSSNLAREVSKGVEEGARRGSMDGSSKGITNLSDNRNIQRQNAF